MRQVGENERDRMKSIFAKVAYVEGAMIVALDHVSHSLDWVMSHIVRLL